jgi:hypothetical protein
MFSGGLAADRVLPESGNGWQLAAGHYYEAIPFTATAYASQVAADTDDFVVFPRPDSEVSSYARHRWAHPDFDYEIPICVKGGAFPYHMEIDTTNTDSALTSTITIGDTHDATNSYVVNIPAATIAGLSTLTDYDIYVKITDQEGSELKCWWSFQKEASDLDHFFFVDKSYTGGTKDGAFDTPFDDIGQAGWLASGDGDSSAQKILVVKEADSAVTPYQKSAGWNQSLSAFPCAIIGLPGERPVFDNQNTRPMWGWAIDDGFFSGFKCTNLRNSFTNDFTGAMVTESGDAFDRGLVWDLVIDADIAFTPSSVNPSVFPFNNISGNRKHIAFYDLDVSNAVSAAAPNGGGIIHLNGWESCLIDKITVTNWGTSSAIDHAFMVKRAITDIEFRRIEALSGADISGATIDIRADNQAGDAQYNNIVITRINVDTPNANEGFQYIANGAVNFTSQDGPLYAYFNTIQGASGVEINKHDDSCASLIDIRKNVGEGAVSATVAGPTDLSGGTTATVTSTDNEESVGASNFNSDGTLTDSYLSSNGLTRGEVGHEIA